MRSVRWIINLALCAVLTAWASALAPTILYSPDAVVDANPNQSYAEPAIAADPVQMGTLVGATESGSFSASPEVFVSHDNGYNWQSAAISLAGMSLMGDVQLAAGMHNLYFASLGYANGTPRPGIQFFISTDHGNTFQHTVFIHSWHSYDHEQLSVDTSDNHFRGRIYMSALYSIQQKPLLHACGLVWSDDGRTFQGPVAAVKGWCFNSRPVVLTNGNLLFPYIYESKFGQHVSKIEVTISSNGGRSFGPPHEIGTYTSLAAAQFNARLLAGELNFDGDPVPQYASYGNTVYVVWSDLATGTDRLLFSRSSDGGIHWTSPRLIVRPTNAADAQYQVAIAVNARGVFGLAFLRSDTAQGTVSEMFTTSTDGGRTFLSPVAIESAPAYFKTMQNSPYGTSSSHYQGNVVATFVPPGPRFPSGGDYVGMDVDLSGAFHPIWIDARTGTDQAWTATTRLGSPAVVPTNVQSTDVSKDVDLQFGTGTWDVATRTLSFPVRLHNIGTRPLYPPFTVTVLLTHFPTLTREEEQLRPEPIIANADNGKSGVGATFTYDAALLGNLGLLNSGAVTAPRVWKIRITSPSVESDIAMRIDANVSR